MTYYVRTDHIGRPVFATDSTGTKVWEAIYLPFGGVMTSTGNPMQLRFPGQWFQSESALHQNWMRDYDPTTGRYIQADPLGLVDGASVYGYARQNPGRYTDPTGEVIPIIMTGAGYAARCAASAACRAAVGAAASAAYGYWTDEDGCYTWEEALVDVAEGAILGAVSGPFYRGAEYGIGSYRIAPFGNRWFFPRNVGSRWRTRWNNSNGKWPHYHVRRPGRGQGKSRHRPWDRRVDDRSFWDRF